MPSETAYSERTDIASKCQCDLDSAKQKQIVEPFREAACHAAAHGFAVVPCGGPADPSGKRPLVRWGMFKSPPSVERIDSWAARPGFHGANLGIITELSGVTVVDCDTPGRLMELYELFGETPMVVATPSGGLHMYYRSSGERCRPFRIGDIKGDIKGLGGFVVAPPSVRTVDGKRTAYQFLEGSWSLREILPPVKPGTPLGNHKAEIVALRPGTKTTGGRSAQAGRMSAATGAPRAARTSSGPVGPGGRNTTLFAELRQIAGYVPDHEELVRRAMAINDTFDPSLELEEVHKVVASVWHYRTEGRLIATGEQAIVTRSATFKMLSAYPGGADALMLLCLLQSNHGGEPGKRFAVSPKPMAAGKLLAGWTAPRYRTAIATLKAVGLLRLVHEGGRRKGDASLYTFAVDSAQQNRRVA